MATTILIYSQPTMVNVSLDTIFFSLLPLVSTFTTAEVSSIWNQS